MSISVTVLGVTGSVGRSTVDVLLQNSGQFRVAAVVAGSDVGGLATAARRVGAEFAALADESRGAELKEALAGSGIASGAGRSALTEAVERDADVVVAAICGVAGLEPTHAALKPGRKLALANKESLVCAGAAFMRDAAAIGCEILPLDSEHNALGQALGSGHRDDVERLTLTASGGPFRTWTRERMARATPAEAGRHPTYSMGAKINIDSASLMNKGLELIEAFHLFGIGPDRLDVVVHPQSIIHGTVHWRDGAVTACMAHPDMRVPIANCLGSDRRIDLAAPRLDFAQIGSFTFEAPDEERFPCLRIARAALARGGAVPTVLNGANEIAVAAFLEGRIGFLDIARVAEAACEALDGPAPASVEEALAIDAQARRLARATLARLSVPVGV